MTKEQAIEVLNTYYRGEDNDDREFCSAIDMAIKALEQQPSDDCVSRESVKKWLHQHVTINLPFLEKEMFEQMENELPSVTPTQCIAAVRFSKEDLRDICNERIEIECTHGTCKDCRHWKDSDGVYRRGVGAESKCPVNNSRVFEGTFCCADFIKRGNENEVD